MHSIRKKVIEIGCVGAMIGTMAGVSMESLQQSKIDNKNELIVVEENESINIGKEGRYTEVASSKIEYKHISAEYIEEIRGEDGGEDSSYSIVDYHSGEVHTSRSYTWRELIKQECTELRGKITYTWGMKPTYEDWSLEEGLDCSGFVEYIYDTVGVQYSSVIESTLTISESCDKIEYSELEIGDLGLIRDGGSYYENSLGETNYTGDFDRDGEVDKDSKAFTNHVGMFIGKDSEGNDLWAHCNAKDGTVVINNYTDFTVYYKVRLIEQ